MMSSPEPFLAAFRAAAFFLAAIDPPQRWRTGRAIIFQLLGSSDVEGGTRIIRLPLREAKPAMPISGVWRPKHGRSRTRPLGPGPRSVPPVARIPRTRRGPERRAVGPAAIAKHGSSAPRRRPRAAAELIDSRAEAHVEETPMSELLRLPLTELTARLARREISPVELMEATLARIDAVDGEINAFVAM